MTTPLACWLCGATGVAPWESFVSCSVLRCTACGFLQVDREPTIEEYQRIYGRHYFAHEKYSLDTAARREYERRLGLLASAGLAPGARVLDGGCATGDFLIAAGDRYDLWGLECSDAAADIARGRIPRLRDRILVGRLEDCPFDDEFFDAIVLWDVVEHLWKAPAVIARLTTKLRPGGVLLLSTPNAGALVARAMGKRWAFMTPPEHLCFFDRHTLRALHERAGLQPEQWLTRGKWTTLAFVFYKLGRVFGFPTWLTEAVKRIRVAGLSVYVPTRDVMYATARRPAKASA